MVDIIIITYNRPDDLLELLESINGFSDKQLLERVIIINNASTVSYNKVIAFIKNQNLKISYSINKINVGVSEGRNIGIRNSKAPIMLFIDDDAVFDTRSTLKKINDLFADQKIGIVSFKVLNYDTKEMQVNAFPHKQFSRMKDYSSFEAPYYTGCCHAIIKSALLRTGLYPNFFYGMEEYDLGYRMIDEGFKIMYSDAVVVLHKESELGRMPEKVKLMGMWQNKAKVAWKYLPLRYFISTSVLWSLKYLKDTKNIIQFIKGIIGIMGIAGNKKSKIKNKTLLYLKSIGARMSY